MSWEEEVREINRRRRLAKQQGGKEGIAKQHARGRLTIRERIDALLDAGTFQEQGLATAIPDYDDNDRLTGFVPANYVVGFGRIDGRRVVVGGEDFTLKGGSPNAAGLRKSVYAEHLAVRAGSRCQNRSQTYDGKGNWNSSQGYDWNGPDGSAGFDGLCRCASQTFSSGAAFFNDCA